MHDVSNDGWRKFEHWANWWTWSRHLQMFTRGYTSRDVEDWEETSNTTNPVESINRQSFKSRNNLNGYSVKENDGNGQPDKP